MYDALVPIQLGLDPDYPVRRADPSPRTHDIRKRRLATHEFRPGGPARGGRIEEQGPNSG